MHKKVITDHSLVVASSFDSIGNKSVVLLLTLNGIPTNLIHILVQTLANHVHLEQLMHFISFEQALAFDFGKWKGLHSFPIPLSVCFVPHHKAPSVLGASLYLSICLLQLLHPPTFQWLLLLTS